MRSLSATRELSFFRQGRHSRYESSEEVLAAIEAVSGVSLPINGEEEENEASRVWADPSPDEMREVAAEAWALADSDDDRLFWGCHTLKRA